MTRRPRLTRETILGALKAQQPALGRYHVKRIGLFGSFADGTSKPSSDIDLLVEFERPSLDDFLQLSAHLERLFGRKVDILTMDGLRSIRIKAVERAIRRSVRYVEAG
jgi:predicted nucleotidyltransferase